MRARVLLVVAISAGWAWASAPAPQRAPGGAAARPAHVAPEARVDVNSASVAELMKVPGMTRTWAERIVRFRPYRTKQDLLDRGVVTSTVYDRIRDSIVAHRQ